MPLKEVVTATIDMDAVMAMANDQTRPMVAEVIKILRGTHECWDALLRQRVEPHRCEGYSRRNYEVRVN